MSQELNQVNERKGLVGKKFVFYGRNTNYIFSIELYIWSKYFIFTQFIRFVVNQELSKRTFIFFFWHFCLKLKMVSDYWNEICL